jgi:hypothetical protein|tara:strand:- start:43 stop:270 length:228 start_codon:yes stop_codon:yes gene_type:complete
MVVGVLFWHDNNRQTTIALMIRILSYNHICFNNRHSGQCSGTLGRLIHLGAIMDIKATLSEEVYLSTVPGNQLTS